VVIVVRERRGLAARSSAGGPRRRPGPGESRSAAGAKPAGSPAPHASRDGAARRDIETPRVLVVDDEPSVRLLLRVNLPLSGFEVVEAPDAETALERAEREAFDLILLDVMMPGMNGLELAQRLKTFAGTSDAPVVFVSARADRADISRGLEVGAADYITKPFDPIRIAERLRAVLDGARREGDR